MIQQQTFDFLKDLRQNNNREWFTANKGRYEAARANVVDFAAGIIKGMSEVDPAITVDMDPKKCVMRIYRDIRFSLDKTPYKSNFGVGRLASGKTTEGIGYYVHIEPGASFAGGGYWQPQPEHIKAIRQEIDYNAAELKAVVDAPDFKKLFGEFRNQESLKTVPRDYSADHAEIALLKLKNFVAMHSFTDAELGKPNAIKNVVGVLSEIYPLNVFLNNAIA
jgi:uncharacterized protein (TIGR02453 family)